MSFQHDAFQHDAFQTFVEGAAGTASDAVKKTVSAAPQADDLSISGWHRHSALRVSGLVPLLIVAASQFNPQPVQATVFKSQPAVAVVASGVPKYVSTLPQLVADAKAVLLAPLRGATPKPIPVTTGAPQQVDLTQQAVLTKPLRGATPSPIPLIVSPPQADPTQLSAQIQPSARTTVVVPNPVATFFSLPPQVVDLTQQAVLSKPLITRQGSVPPSVVVGQVDQTQLAAQIQPSARTTAAVSGVIPPFTLAAPEQIDLGIEAWTRQPSLSGGMATVAPLVVASGQLDTTQQCLIWLPSLVSVAVANPVASFFSGSPQTIDLTQQAVLSKPLITRQGSVPPSVVVGQVDPTQIQGQVWSSVRTPPAPSTGPVPAPTIVPPQADLSQLAAQVWSSVRTPPAPVSGIIPPFMLAAPEQIDLGIEAWTRQPSLSGGFAAVAPLLYASAQADPGQLAAQVWSSVRTPPAAVQGAVPKITLVPPQADPSQFAAQVWKPLTDQGSGLSSEFRFGGHAVVTHLAEREKTQIWRSLRTPPAAVQGPVPPTILVPPQADPSQLAAQVWESVQIGGTPPPSTARKPIFAFPQADPSQLAAQVWKPLTDQGSGLSSEFRFGGHAVALHSAEQQKTWVQKSAMGGQRSIVIPFVVGQAQTDPTQIAAQTWPSVRTPPAILGITVPPLPAVLPQDDLTVNNTQVWTSSTFSPSAPVVEETRRGKRSSRLQPILDAKIVLKKISTHTAVNSLTVEVRNIWVGAQVTAIPSTNGYTTAEKIKTYSVVCKCTITVDAHIVPQQLQSVSKSNGLVWMYGYSRVRPVSIYTTGNVQSTRVSSSNYMYVDSIGTETSYGRVKVSGSMNPTAIEIIQAIEAVNKLRGKT